jgi:uncharacterized protein YraI
MKRVLLSTAVVAGALAAVTLAPAPASSAPAAWSKPRACNAQAAAVQLHTTDAVHLRSGRGAHHRSRGVLPRSTDVYAECWGLQGDAWWAYGRVMSGPLKGRTGWVSGDYLATGYRH